MPLTPETMHSWHLCNGVLSCIRYVLDIIVDMRFGRPSRSLVDPSAGGCALNISSALSSDHLYDLEGVLPGLPGQIFQS